MAGKQVAGAETRIERDAAGVARPTEESELTWLLHRAAHRVGTAVSEQTVRHGLQLRDFVVLSALVHEQSLTQIELSRLLGIDKTTLTAQIDRLEGMGLVERTPDPRDRRRRIPRATAQGTRLQRRAATAFERAEAETVAAFSPAESATLRRMLVAIIGDVEDPGSCM